MARQSLFPVFPGVNGAQSFAIMTSSDAGRAPAHAITRFRAAVAFIALLALYFVSYFQRVAVPGTIFDELQNELGAASAVATLGALFTIVYGCMQLFVGLLADRYGGGRVALVGGFFLAAGSLAFPFAHISWQFYAARLLTGFGASFIFLCLIKETDRLFSPRLFTVLLGVVLLVGYSGGVVATWPMAHAAAAWGWREALWIAGLAAVATMALALPALCRLRSPLDRETLSLRPFFEVLRNRTSWSLLVSSLLYFPVFFCVQSIFGKKFLQDVAGMASTPAAMLVLAMTGVSAFAGILGGFLPNWLGFRRKPCLVAASAIIAAGTVIILLGIACRASVAVYSAGYFLLALGLMGNPAAAATMKELNRPAITAAAVSVTNALAYLGCSLLGHAGGVILECYRHQAQATADGIIYPPAAYLALFAFFSLAAIINLLVVSFMPETGGRHLPAGA